MRRTLRYAGAVCAAGVATWLFPMLLSAYIVMTDTVDRAGDPGDAPGRAMLLFWILSPVPILALGLLDFILALILKACRLYTLRYLLALSGLIGLVLGIIVFNST